MHYVIASIGSDPVTERCSLPASPSRVSFHGGSANSPRLRKLLRQSQLMTVSESTIPDLSVTSQTCFGQNAVNEVFMLFCSNLSFIIPSFFFLSFSLYLFHTHFLFPFLSHSLFLPLCLCRHNGHPNCISNYSLLISTASSDQHFNSQRGTDPLVSPTRR